MCDLSAVASAVALNSHGFVLTSPRSLHLNKLVTKAFHPPTSPRANNSFSISSLSAEFGRDTSDTSSFKMPSFTELPTEILLKIIADCCPNGIEELALCSQSLYKISEGHLKQHRLDKKEKSSLGGQLDGFEGEGFDGFDWQAQDPKATSLSSMLQWPSLASYVTEFTLSHTHNNTKYWEMDNVLESLNCHTARKETLFHQFFDVDGCRLIASKDKSKWRALLRQGHVVSISCMLLLRFECLENITIVKGEDQDILVSFVTQIANINRSRAKNGLTPFALGALSSIDLGCYDLSAPEMDGVMEAFAMLPSMRRVLIMDDAQRTFNAWQSEQLKCDVIDLRFKWSSLTCQSLSNVMGHVASLEHFTYIKHHSDLGDEVGQIIRTLNTFAKQSLKSIELGTFRPTCGADITDKARSCCVSSLADFDSLQRVKAEFEMFIYKMDTSDRWKAACLVDCLPASIEVVTILDEGIYIPEIPATFPDLFHNLAESRSNRLPNLKQIIINRFGGHPSEWARPCWIEVSKELIAQCEEVGIALLLGGRD